MAGKKDRETAAKGAALHVRGGRRYGLAALLFALFAFCFLMNLLSPLAADDFSYALSYVDGSKVKTLGEAVRSMAAHYRIHGGRVIVHFFATVFMMLPKPAFDACNALMTVLLVVLIAAHIRPGEPIRAGVPAVLFSACWFFLPVWGHTVFFLTGACNYLWPMVVTLAFLLWIRVRGAVAGPAETAVAFFAGLLSGAQSEMASGACLLCVALMIGTALVRHRPVPGSMWMAFSGCLAGFVFLIAAPGNYVRLDGGGYAIGNLVSLFLVYTRNFLLRCAALGLPAAVMLLCGREFPLKREDLRFPALFLLCAAASNYAMLLSGQYPPRAQFTYAVYLVLAFGALYAKILPGLLTDTVLRVLAGFCVLIFLTHASGTLNDFGAVYLQDRARVESARAQQAAGITDIVVDPIDPRSAYSSLSIGDLTEDPEHWINRGYRLYYGVPSVRIP